MTTFFSSAKTIRPALALLGLGLGAGLAGCQVDVKDTTPTPAAGSANFTRYIAVGNSLTAGYADDGLYLEGQQTSYPNILAQQFAQAGGGAFNQPLFTAAQASGSGYLRLAGFTAAGSPITARVPGTAGRLTPTAAPYTKYLSAVENLGVPGIRLSDIHTADLGNLTASRPTGLNATNFNPFFERITPDGNSQTYFQRVKAEAATATFFTCWLGNNDVLGYATSGGALAGLASNYAITRTDTFNLKAIRIINALTANGAKGVVSNIPDVAGIPFFTTVGPSARASFAAANVPTAAPFVYITGAQGPGATNTKNTATLNDIRTSAGGTLLLTLTAAPYIGLYGQPTGKYWRDFYAQLRPSLPATIPSLTVFLAVQSIDTTKAFGASTANPFPSALVLDAAEQTAVTTATTAFNNSLGSAASLKGLAIFDANTFFRSLAGTGFATNGVNNTTAFISGNLFSLDGVHPSPRGYALVANELIRLINIRYNSTLRQVDASSYRGVLFP